MKVLLNSFYWNGHTLFSEIETFMQNENNFESCAKESLKNPWTSTG